MNKLDKSKKWFKWFVICDNLHSAVVNFYANSSRSAGKSEDNRLVHDNVPLDEATAVGSKITKGGFKEQHQVMFDLDVPHVYIESQTRGHGHLIFKQHVSWGQYKRLMSVMVECGLIEHGYYKACLSRGEAWLRTPWTAKGKAGNVAV